MSGYTIVIKYNTVFTLNSSRHVNKSNKNLDRITFLYFQNLQEIFEIYAIKWFHTMFLILLEFKYKANMYIDVISVNNSFHF